jgi:hypothetical protein
LILVEDEANLVSPEFVGSFSEALRFYSLFFDSLEESFPRASNERLMLERTCARKLVNMLSCDPSESVERQETGVHWESRLRQVGFQPAPFSLDVVDDVQALLKRYNKLCMPDRYKLIYLFCIIHMIMPHAGLIYYLVRIRHH